MKISYLVTCSTETDSLKKLLDTLKSNISKEDEIVVLFDKKYFHLQNPSFDIVMSLCDYENSPFKIINKNLDDNYSEFKNFGIENCEGKWIFQLDGDEIPNKNLLLNIKEITSLNSDVDLFYVPRINDYIGVSNIHSSQWGWRLNDMTFYRPSENKIVVAPTINFPDYQSRIFIRDYPRIHWERKLHEKVEGHTKHAFLPAEEDFSIYHWKTIEKQMETNLRYNQVFTEEENRGHIVK